MPRTRRTPASDHAATDAADVATPSSPDAPAPDAAESSGASEAKPVRRRAPRRPKEMTPVAVTEAAPPADAPTPEPDAPKRRRGRRTATPAAEAPAPETAPEAAGDAAPSAPEQAAEPAAPTRRRGRPRKTAAPDAAPADPEFVPLTQVETALPEVLTPQEPTAEAETSSAPTEAAPARRRGRRRSSAAMSDSQTPPPSLELPDVEAPVAEAGGEAASEESDEKRSRRGRRSRRRRGGSEEPTTESLEAAGAGLLVSDEAIPVDVPDDEDDDTPLIYPPPAAPVYFAPPLVPPVLPPADSSRAARVAASVRHTGRGLAQIEANGQTHAPYFFFVNAETARDGETVNAQIREAAANGIHLFSGVLSLPLRNAYGDRSFGAVDALIQQILAADPDGLILPRLQFFPTNFWARTHPDQMARDTDGTEGDVSLGSTEFWADCADALEALIAHLADPATFGGDRVLGFHLDRGEWFYDAAAGYDRSEPNRIAFGNWLHAKYQSLHSLRAAWHDAEVTFEDAAVPDWPGATAAVKKTDTPLYSARREGRWPDYALFSSEIVADIISGLASAVKTLSGGRMIVAVSYGYTLEFAGRNDSGHLALGRLLRSPDVDIVAGPNSYPGRGAGSPAAFPSPLDSVALAGKLWLVEDDTKTFLAEAETEDTYNPKIASGADTQAIHQRHFGAALAHRAGVTWMDLWGQGWLNSPDIWRELGGLAAQAGRWEQITPVSPPPPDVAVLVDEASLAYLKNDPAGLGVHLVGRTRDLLLRAGGSVGFYLQSDLLRDNFPDSKLVLFLNALRLTTAERQAVREKLQKPGKTLAWVYAPGVFDENGPATEEVGEVVGMALRPQPWDSRGGSQVLEIRHPLTERLRGTKRIGQDEILNPLYAVSDPQATALAEYGSSSATSLATREHKSGWKSVFFGDPYLTIELLRGLYAYANVPVYDGQDDIVFADGGGSLTIHGPFAGQRTVSLPRRASVYDVFEDKIIATNARTFRAFVRARTTRLFLWGDGDALARATGLDLPAQTAEVADVPALSTPPPVSAPPPLSSRADAPARESRPDLIPGLESVGEGEPLDALGTEDREDDSTGETSEGADGEDATPARRSRWQRRRAATRARREAERAAQVAGGTPDSSDAANPPVDMETLLPGLPPRRTSPSSAAEAAAPKMFRDAPPALLSDVPADRVADIVAADTADDPALGLPDAVLLDMADDLAAEEEAASDALGMEAAGE